MVADLTFVILAKNEARNIGRALGSLPAGARALVIDAESSDDTVALARARGADVAIRPWAGFVATRRAALALVETEWTFMLDADESLDDALRANIVALMPNAETDAYRVRRTNYFCGRPMRHGPWALDTPLRLFRTARGTLVAEPAAGGSADVHERWTVPGRASIVEGSLAHDSYPTLAAYRLKFARYTSLEAGGLRGSFPRFARTAAIAALRVPWYVIVRAGWRDGVRGTFVAIASAAYPAVVAWKAWRRA